MIMPDVSDNTEEIADMASLLPYFHSKLFVLSAAVIAKVL